MDLKHYFIISNICLAISYILFRLLNRDETMFRQRRIFILLSIILSLTLPLSRLQIQLPYSTGSSIVYIIDTRSADIQAEYPGKFKNDINILFIYLIISGVIVLNILFQLIRVCWFYLFSDVKDGNIIKVNSHRLKGPFSFFTWIFIPCRQVREEDLCSIIIHESVHGKQLHTADNIILEIACALMWFNPFIWIMKREIHLLHEYLADEGTLNSGIGKITYQSMLINQVAEEKLIVIPSNFNNNNLKKRIIMMTKNKKEGHNGLVRRKLIPLSLLILAVSILQGFYPVNVKAQNGNQQQQKKQQEQVKEKNSKEVFVIGYAKPDPNSNYIVDGVYAKTIENINPDSIESVNVLKEDKTIIVRTRSYARKSADGKNTNIQIRSVDGKNENILYFLDGKEVSKDVFENLSPEQIQSVTVLKDKEQMKIYTEKDFDGVIDIRTKKDYKSTGEKTSSMKTVVVTGYGKQDSISSKHIEIRKEGGGNPGNTLYIVDGKEVSREYFEGIYPENIQSVTVIKDKDQMKIYTRKDYAGVIVITTKK